MKFLRQIFIVSCYAFLLALTAYNADAQYNNTANFESSWGIWNDGGSDAYRLYDKSLSGSYIARIRDNSGSASSIYTNYLDLTGHDIVQIEFDYFPISMEQGEDFVLEYSANGGSSYELIKSYTRAKEFENNQKYTDKVTILKSFGPQTVFRFRCDASSNYDKVYLDNIKLSAELESCICTTEYDPVCGVDGKTYPNSCEAYCAGVAIAHQGICDPFAACEDYLSTIRLDGLCDRCISEVALYQYQGQPYLVEFPNTVYCADAATTVTSCPEGALLCQDGGIAGLNQCANFFANATKIRTVAKEECAFVPACNYVGVSGGLSQIVITDDRVAAPPNFPITPVIEIRGVEYYNNATGVGGVAPECLQNNCSPTIIFPVESGLGQSRFTVTIHFVNGPSCQYQVEVPFVEDCICLTDEYVPVCGVDGITYNNACEADCAGVMIAHPGECDCICTTEYAPVCAADGNTYSNACQAACAGALVLYNGPCDPFADCEDFLTRVLFGPLCESCISEIALYSYQGNPYLVSFPNNITCADGATQVTSCPDGTTLCMDGGIAGLTQCTEFFNQATKIRVIVSEDCSQNCICTDEYDPVCGVDGKTYSNACEAACAGVAIAAPGECDCVCPAIFDPVCGVDGTTYFNACEAACVGVAVAAPGECGCVCLAIYDPVCGVDGTTYPNACEAACAGVTVLYNGECSCICTDEVDPVCGVNGITYFNACEAACAGVAIAVDADCGCTLNSDDDFENTWGSWNDGGHDCFRKYIPSLSPEGSYSARLRDNSGIKSSMFTDNLQFAGKKEIQLEFNFLAESMESGEDFLLEYSLNGGQSFKVAKSWVSGQNLFNDIAYYEEYKINDNFTNQTVIRFRCDASSNYDKVYIGDVKIYACDTRNFASDTDGINRVKVTTASDAGFDSGVDSGIDSDDKTELTVSPDSKLEIETKLTVYPNPANNVLNITGLSGRTYEVINMTGQKVIQESREEILNISDLQSASYILRTQDGQTIRFVKI